jgi:hypothetical protein
MTVDNIVSIAIWISAALALEWALYEGSINIVRLIFNIKREPRYLEKYGWRFPIICIFGLLIWAGTRSAQAWWLSAAGVIGLLLEVLTMYYLSYKADRRSTLRGEGSD